MFFLVQIGIHKHLYIFSQIALTLQACAILLVFEKIYSCLFIPNCTRNHMITYTNKTEWSWRYSFRIAHEHEENGTRLNLCDRAHAFF